MRHVALDDLDVRAVVAERKFVFVRRPHRNTNRILDQAGALERMQHRVETLGPLRMACARPMLFINFVRQYGGRGRHSVRPSPESYPALGTLSSTDLDRSHRGRFPVREIRD